MPDLPEDNPTHRPAAPDIQLALLADIPATPKPAGLFTEAELAAITKFAGPKLRKSILLMHSIHGLTEGRTCATCVHLERHKQSTRWLKCGKSVKTSGAATDWRAGWPACGLYKESTDAR